MFDVIKNLKLGCQIYKIYVTKSTKIVDHDCRTNMQEGFGIETDATLSDLFKSTTTALIFFGIQQGCTADVLMAGQKKVFLHVQGPKTNMLSHIK